MSTALHRVQGARVAARRRGRGWFRSTGAIPLVARRGSVRDRRRPARVPRGATSWRPVYPRYSDVVLVGVGACLIANAALCLGTLVFNRRAWRRRTAAGQAGGRALGGVPPLPLRLPAPAGGAARDARAVGALPRLRDRVRDRRARAPGRAAAHARGAARGELDLLDLAARRPRLGRDEPLDRRPRFRLRERPRAAELRARAEAAAASPAEAAEAEAEAAEAAEARSTAALTRRQRRESS